MFENTKENKKKTWEEIQPIDNFVGNQRCIYEILALWKKVLMGDLDSLLKGEEIHWKQKAKCKWLKEGDNNTKFFHKVAYGKKRKSLITRMNV